MPQPNVNWNTINEIPFQYVLHVPDEKGSTYLPVKLLGNILVQFGDSPAAMCVWLFMAVPLLAVQQHAKLVGTWMLKASDLKDLEILEADKGID